jgi:hypothetical protein
MSADYSDEPSCTRRGSGWVDFSILEKKPRKRVKIRKRKNNNERSKRMDSPIR